MRKNLHLLAIALLITLVASTAVGSDLCGDANSDGAVGISDAVYLIAYVFSGGSAPEPLFAADVNRDSEVDISDAVCLITYVLSGDPLPDCPPVTDINGNIYQTVTIGTQVWIAENLKVTHYRNGYPIPHVTDNATWANISTGAYCSYDNDPGHIADYGRLYNWYAVSDIRGIAPQGWHVPTHAEWQTLVDYLGGLAVAGGKMKEAGLSHWNSPNSGATNESGFTARAGGYRKNDGSFGVMGKYAYLWSSSGYDSGRAWFRAMYYLDGQIHNYYFGDLYGFSVRCVKD